MLNIADYFQQLSDNTLSLNINTLIDGRNNDIKDILSTIFNDWCKMKKVEKETPVMKNENVYLKSLPRAQEYRSLGNEAFEKKKLLDALFWFNQALSYCPFESSNDKVPLMCYVYGNRAILFYQMDLYVNSLLDINRAIDLYPLNGSDGHRIKLLLRQLRILKQLSRNPDHMEMMVKTLLYLNDRKDGLQSEDKTLIECCMDIVDRSKWLKTINTINRSIDYSQVQEFDSLCQILKQVKGRLPYQLSKDNLSTMDLKLCDVISPKCLFCGDAHFTETDFHEIGNNWQKKFAVGDICKKEQPILATQCLLAESTNIFAPISMSESKLYCAHCFRNLTRVACVPCYKCSTAFFCSKDCLSKACHCIWCPYGMDIWWDKLDIFSRIVFSLHRNWDLRSGLMNEIDNELFKLSAILITPLEENIDIDKKELIYFVDQTLSIMDIIVECHADSASTIQIDRLATFERYLHDRIIVQHLREKLLSPVFYKVPYFERTLMNLNRIETLRELRLGHSINEILSNVLSIDRLLGFAMYPLEGRIDRSNEDANVSIINYGMVRTLRARKDLSKGDKLVAINKSIPADGRVKNESINMEEYRKMATLEYTNFNFLFNHSEQLVKYGNKKSNDNIKSKISGICHSFNEIDLEQQPFLKLIYLFDKSLLASNEERFIESIECTNQCLKLLLKLSDIDYNHQVNLKICFLVRLARLEFELCTEARLSDEESTRWAKECLKHSSEAINLLMERTIIFNANAPFLVASSGGFIDHLIEINIPILIELEDMIVATTQLIDTNQRCRQHKVLTEVPPSSSSSSSTTTTTVAPAVPASAETSSSSSSSLLSSLSSLSPAECAQP